VRVPVAWGDMDAFGHVNNVLYLRYMETSRLHYFVALERRGLVSAAQSAEWRSGRGVGPILKSVACTYERPVHFPDTLLVATRVARIGRSSLLMRHAFASCHLNQLVATGESVIVAFDYRAQATCPVPAW